MHILPWRVRRRIKIAKRMIRRRIRKPDRNTYPLEVGEFDGFTIAYRKDSVDEMVLANSFDNDRFFSDAPEYVSDPNHVILDVGAHIGTFSVLAATKVKTVYAVEACRETYNFLSINIALNQIDNVLPYHIALSHSNDSVVLYHAIEGNWGNTIMYGNKRASETVEALSLDQFFRANDLGKVNFAKLNCEGAEFPILLAASLETLACIEVMMILYHEDLSNGQSHHLIVDRLKAAGFVVRGSGARERGVLIAKHKNACDRSV